jgi:starch-binding outer membrane protein, SusD/RagB family
MKNKIIITLTLLSLIWFSSCKEYLDVDSASLGLFEDEIFSEFTEYENFLDFAYDRLNRVYNGRNTGSGGVSTNVATRCFPMTVGDQMRSQDKSATENLLLDVGFVETHYRTEKWNYLWETIRMVNIAIANHHFLIHATQAQKNGLIGQAYMARALAYQFLLEVWGGMPYLTVPVTADQMDFARDTYYHTCLKIAQDCDSAVMFLPARWDKGPSVSGDGYANSDYVASSDTRRFTSVLALAVKSRTLLYAASPFAQDSKTDEDVNSTQQDWEAAAIAANMAINAAEDNNYLMLPFEKIHENFYNVFNNGEGLYSIPDGMNANQHAASGLFGTFTTPFSLTQRTSEEQCAVFATHDIAERFEAVKYGGGSILSAKPIVTYNAGGTRTYHGEDPDMRDFYNEQNPFNDPNDISSAKPSPVYPGHGGYGRDPRFYKFMIYHGRAIDRWGKAGETWDVVLNRYGGGKMWENFTGDRSMARRFDMSVGSYDLKQIKSPTYDNTTGYFTGKFWSLGVNNILGSYTRMHHPYPIYRVAELYLNYAEAANQAYGGPMGTAPGARYSAADALNKVRKRATMPNVDVAKYNTVNAFHDRVFNERCVELCFETNHSFVDVRRWKLIGTQDYREVYTMKISLDASGDIIKYPTGYVYKPELLELKSYNPKFYLCPVMKYDVDRSTLFKQNPGY